MNINKNNQFFFVIYEHGIKHHDAICNEIEKSGIHIDKKINLQLPFNKFQNFILDIYPDTDKRHVINKNRYIINFCKNKNTVRAIILLTTIDNWTQCVFGKFGNKCKEIELIKRRIRNLYNPKFSDINKQKLPLNKGVSHNHVLHSIDFPNEFPLIYNIFNKYMEYIIIDLLDFFSDMKDYTIMKIDKNFPVFNIGKDDVDILCLDSKKTIKHIINILSKNYKQYNYKQHKFGTGHNQLDVYYLNKFIVKFDLFDNLATTYSSFDIPSDLTEKVIKNSVLKNGVKIPLIEDELMIRYLEYHKWIKKRPDKIKHLNYIKSHPNVKYKIFKKK